jgi:hypothetical protein
MLFVHKPLTHSSKESWIKKLFLGLISQKNDFVNKKVMDETIFNVSLAIIA